MLSTMSSLRPHGPFGGVEATDSEVRTRPLSIHGSAVVLSDRGERRRRHRVRRRRVRVVEILLVGGAPGCVHRGVGSVQPAIAAVLLVTEVVVPGLVGIALLGDSVRSGW